MADSSDYSLRLLGYTEGKDPLTMQRETPALLAGLIAGVEPARLIRPPAPGKWSVGEILAHLAEDELTTTWRYRQMIESPGVALTGFNQELWATLGDYRSWTPQDGLEMFRLLREANVRMLEGLTLEQWECYGKHAERGRITVRSLARHMAGHDRNHLDQIRRIVGRS